MSFPLFDLVAREHPAFIHIPLGLAVTLPLVLLWSYRARDPEVWVRSGLFMAATALSGGLSAIYSGLLWARKINLVPADSFFPQISSSSQALQQVMRRHELVAILGYGVGLVCLILLWRTLHRASLRSVALIASLAWAVAWGFTGKQGGIMVFGDAETNRAAAAADAKRRADTEAELPIRALDYASLEPASPKPFLSKAHGGHWGRVWVTASAVDDYQSGKPLPAGAYAVMSTVLDAQGRPGFEPGPLLMRETRTGGGQAFAFYWPRVPEARRSDTGGQDSVYWRSPAPQLAACDRCHPNAGPASKP